MYCMHAFRPPVCMLPNYKHPSRLHASSLHECCLTTYLLNACKLPDYMHTDCMHPAYLHSYLLHASCLLTFILPNHMPIYCMHTYCMPPAELHTAYLTTSIVGILKIYFTTTILTTYILNVLYAVTYYNYLRCAVLLSSAIHFLNLPWLLTSIQQLIMKVYKISVLFVEHKH